MNDRDRDRDREIARNNARSRMVSTLLSSNVEDIRGAAAARKLDPASYPTWMALINAVAYYDFPALTDAPKGTDS